MIPILLNSAPEFMGIRLMDIDDFLNLILRFFFNFTVILIIVRGIYYKKTNRKDFLFTFLMIGVSIFLMCFLLESVKLQLGFALGLFAVFGIIRYRTTTIQIKEMTYLFIVISISVINAIANKKISYSELVFANLIVLATCYFIERLKILETEYYTVVMYEKIELVTPGKKTELIADLELRLGLQISRIEIGNLDYARDIAKISVFFYKSKQNLPDEMIGYKTKNDE